MNWQSRRWHWRDYRAYWQIRVRQSVQLVPVYVRLVSDYLMSRKHWTIHRLMHCSMQHCCFDTKLENLRGRTGRRYGHSWCPPKFGQSSGKIGDSKGIKFWQINLSGLFNQSVAYTHAPKRKSTDVGRILPLRPTSCPLYSATNDKLLFYDCWFSLKVFDLTGLEC